MNIIYNVCQSPPQVFIILSEFNGFLIKRIDLNDDFSRILRQPRSRHPDAVPKTNWPEVKNKLSERGVDYGRSIRYGAIMIEIKGAEKQGIFI